MGILDVQVVIDLGIVNTSGEAQLPASTFTHIPLPIKSVKIDAAMGATYHVKETAIQAIKVRLNSLKERGGLHSCILVCNTGVHTAQVKLEILEKLD